jgi:hypothetical protein
MCTTLLRRPGHVPRSYLHEKAPGDKPHHRVPTAAITSLALDSSDRSRTPSTPTRASCRQGVPPRLLQPHQRPPPRTSPLPSTTPNSVHRPAGLLPEPSPLYLAVGNRRILAGRCRPSRPTPFPYFSSSGRKCRVGRATSLAGWAMSLLSQPTATVAFLFYTSD